MTSDIPLDHEQGMPFTEDERMPRALPRRQSLDALARSRSGGGMARLDLTAERALREFVLIRDPGGVIKMPLAHVALYRALVRASWSKRVAGEADPGVSVNEIAEAGGFDPDAIRPQIRSLVRNRVARSKTLHVGYQGTRALYYPTARGEEVLGIAEVLGHGSLVQVGRPVNAWKGRNMTEPSNIFQIAQLITRGIAPENH